MLDRFGRNRYPIATFLWLCCLCLNITEACVDTIAECARNGEDICRDPDGYNGTKNVTVSGKECQRWNLQTPHTHSLPAYQHNYCRNPDNEPGPWCYTTDQNTRWELCFETCNDNCPPTYNGKFLKDANFLSNPERPVGTVAIMVQQDNNGGSDMYKLTCVWNQDAGMAEWIRSRQSCPFNAVYIYSKSTANYRLITSNFAEFYNTTHAMCALKCFGKFSETCGSFNYSPIQQICQLNAACPILITNEADGIEDINFDLFA